MLTRSVTSVDCETDGVDEGGSVSVRLDPQVSVVSQADVVVGDVDRLERVVALVERLGVHDEGRLLLEQRHVLAVVLRISTQVGAGMADVPVGAVGIHQRDTAWTDVRSDGVPGKTASHEERGCIYCNVH